LFTRDIAPCIVRRTYTKRKNTLEQHSSVSVYAYIRSKVISKGGNYDTITPASAGGGVVLMSTGMTKCTKITQQVITMMSIQAFPLIQPFFLLFLHFDVAVLPLGCSTSNSRNPWCLHSVGPLRTLCDI